MHHLDTRGSHLTPSSSRKAKGWLYPHAPTLPIGQIIKTRVEYLGMSKAELARRLNMSPANVHKIFKRDTIEVTQLCPASARCCDTIFWKVYRIEVMRTHGRLMHGLNSCRISGGYH